jgi:hypothetical protein
MSDVSQGAGWWMASDHKWYPPDLLPGHLRVPAQVSQVSAEQAPGTPDADSYWHASRGPQLATAPPIPSTFFGSQGSDHTPSDSRARRRLLLAGLGVIAAVVILAVGLVVVLGESHGGLSGKTAKQVLAVTVAAAEAQGSVHLATTNTSGPPGSGTYDVNRSDGRQTVTNGAQGNADFLAVPGHAYVKGDATFLQNGLGAPASDASLYAGKWISFTPSDPGYQQIAAADTLASAIGESTPTGALTLLPTRTVDGQTVEGVSGGLPHDISQGGAKGSQVLYVSTTAPYLPVEVVTSGSLDGHSGTTVVTFSRWGESVYVAAPIGAIPISSISS